ncbi:MAG: urease accessory protein UreG [Verrucomicrobiota bacterium]
MKEKKSLIRVGIGGPVGCGKTTIALKLCQTFRDQCDMAVITNDIYTQEDAQMLRRESALSEDRIMGVETGGCPHTAIRDDIAMNLAAIDEMQQRIPGLEMIIIESGGDNLTATFSPELVDIFIYVIDVSGGEDIPRKGGPAIAHSDLLIINKIDLASHVGVSLENMDRDTHKVRDAKPYLLCDMRSNKGVDSLVEWVKHDVLFADVN